MATGLLSQRLSDPLPRYTIGVRDVHVAPLLTRPRALRAHLLMHALTHTRPDRATDLLK